MYNLKKVFSVVVLLVTVFLTVKAQSPTYSWQHLPHAALPVFKKDTVSILKFGAKADGLTLNTKSIKKHKQCYCSV
jgi:hypothetical protein